MTDRLPVGAVAAITLYRCPVHGWMEQATVNLGIDSGQGCPVIEGESACWEKMEGPKRFAALPPSAVIVVGEDGQVTCRTQEEAARVISDALWLKEVRHLFSDDARRAIAALSATDAEGKT